MSASLPRFVFAVLLLLAVVWSSSSLRSGEVLAGPVVLTAVFVGLLVTGCAQWHRRSR
jgi:hypothetical protein